MAKSIPGHLTITPSSDSSPFSATTEFKNNSTNVETFEKAAVHSRHCSTLLLLLPMKYCSKGRHSNTAAQLVTKMAHLAILFVYISFLFINNTYAIIRACTVMDNTLERLLLPP